MTRWIVKLVVLSAFVVAGSFGINYYQDRYSVRRELEVAREENRVLARIVERLGDETRRAEVLVTDQKHVDGELVTTLLFVEYDKLNESLPPKSFQIKGNMAHFDAMVIKFDREFVKAGDPLRGHSIALFTRVYGDRQTPEQGFPIDTPGSIPDITRGADPKVTQFEKDLWQQFWKLTDDPQLRQEKGVRVANGQGVWGPFEPDKLYTITLESSGGLNIRSEPLKGIYREALKRSAATQPSDHLN